MALKFSKPIVKRLFNRKSMSSNIAYMPVANKVGQKVKQFLLSIFRKKKIDD